MLHVDTQYVVDEFHALSNPSSNSNSIFALFLGPGLDPSIPDS